MPKSAPAPTPIKPPAKRSPGQNLQLQIGLITVPIKLHTGARAERISFRQLHDKCLGRLKQGSMHCPHCDEDVAGDEIVKGYEYAKDQYVVVSKEELEAQKPESSTVISIERFVDENSVDPIYFETSHYIAPGDGGARGYALVRDVLTKAGKLAIGRATLSNSEHIVLIRPYGNGLALHTLYYQDELKSFAFPVDQIAISPAEMKLAGELVKTMSGIFNPADFSDSYAANVKELVAAKIGGKPAKVIVRKPRAVHDDLLGALTASLAAKSSRKAA